MKVPEEAFYQGRIQWGEPPSWMQQQQQSKRGKGTGTDSSYKGKNKSANAKSDDNTGINSKTSISNNNSKANVCVAVGEWKEAIAPNGKTYYWCVHTYIHMKTNYSCYSHNIHTARTYVLIDR